MIEQFGRRISLKKLLLMVVMFPMTLLAQTDDLMFVEYVDWTNGSGWAVKVYNPTNSTISLSDYYLRIYRNGASVYTENEQLSGTLSSKSSIIIGNEAYCNVECSGSCNITLVTLGINGNEILELSNGTCTIDLIGAIGIDMGSQNGWTVDGTSKATYRHTLTRKIDNGYRYRFSDGVAPYSWPHSKSTNFQGWIVSGVKCLTPGFTLTANVAGVVGGKEQVNFDDSTVCEGQTVRVTNKRAVNWKVLPTNATKTNSSFYDFSGSAGVYYVIAINEECNGENDTATIRVLPNGQIIISPSDQTVCEGESVWFTTNKNGGNTWHDGSTNDTLWIKNASVNQEIRVFNSSFSCGSPRDTTQLTVVGKPSVPNYSKQIGFTKDSVISLLDIVNSDAYSYSQWYVDGVPYGNLSYTYVYDDDVELCLVYGEIISCVDTICLDLLPMDKVTIVDFELFIPNVFTPNKDGLNEMFTFYVTGGKTEVMEIYNRWGERLYEGGEDDVFEWDGSYRGGYVPQSTYFFFGKVRNNSNNEIEIVSGTIQVLR